MSYRSIKRALGETNIERKCRIFFGICLGIVVCGAFLWVDRIGESLVEKTNVQIGQDFATLSLIKLHLVEFVTDESHKPFIADMSDELLGQEYGFTVLDLDEDDIPYRGDSRGTPTDDEYGILEDLKNRLATAAEEHEREQLSAGDSEDSAEPVTDTTAAFTQHVARTVHETRAEPESDSYFYYQPVEWTSDRCADCHYPSLGTFSVADATTNTAYVSQPFRVMRVTLPYAATRKLVAETRAVLIAAAILTIFLAMVALYVIVRYVIVKPLKHLRDVSEAVSRGESDLRADIRTNDEFEDLADSFNRMLQHLIEAQGELRTVNTSLDAKVDELAQLNMRLYEMNRLKSDFLANMSHELRTPLNSIIGFSEVLQGIESLSERQKRYAHNIQKSGRVLLEMINDILDLAKLEAGKMELRPSEFQIDVVVSAQCDMVRPLSEEKNIDLEFTPLGHESMAYQDQSKVQQILTNLLSNAIKFTPEGGRITVKAERPHPDKLRLSVADTGVGIPEEDHEIIFEKFRQSETVLGSDGLTREFSGTGLGLSIVKELCKLLGGEITFDSELGRGSTFKVVIPWALKTSGSTLGSEVSDRLDRMSRGSAPGLGSDSESVSPSVTTAD